MNFRFCTRSSSLIARCNPSTQTAQQSRHAIRARGRAQALQRRAARAPASGRHGRLLRRPRRRPLRPLRRHHHARGRAVARGAPRVAAGPRRRAGRVAAGFGNSRGEGAMPAAWPQLRRACSRLRPLLLPSRASPSCFIARGRCRANPRPSPTQHDPSAPRRSIARPCLRRSMRAPEKRSLLHRGCAWSRRVLRRRHAPPSRQPASPPAA